MIVNNYILEAKRIDITVNLGMEKKTVTVNYLYQEFHCN